MIMCSAFSRGAPSDTHGFTLLELVLVMFILAILTATGMAFIESEDGQHRYDASIEKRDAIVAALYSESRDGHQKTMAGFLVDNGVLPPITTTDNAAKRTGYFLEKPVNWLSFGSQLVYIHTGQTEVPSAEGFELFKGYRQSAYLPSDKNPVTYRDGWGQHFFVSNIVLGQMTLGYDGDGGLDFDGDGNPDETQLIKPAPFDRDNDRTIGRDDWSVDVGQLNILFTNGTCAPRTGPCTYEIAVVVFRNAACTGAEENCWDTYHFTTRALNDGDTHDTAIHPTDWRQNNAAIQNPNIPAGEHLALALSAAGNATSEAAARFPVFPRSIQPRVTLTAP